MELKHGQRLYINEGIRCSQASLASSACTAEGLEDFLLEHSASTDGWGPHLLDMPRSSELIPAAGARASRDSSH